MTAHSAHKVARMLAEGFQHHGDKLVLETMTLTVFKGSRFTVEHDDGTTYTVTVDVQL